MLYDLFEFVLDFQNVISFYVECFSVQAYKIKLC